MKLTYAPTWHQHLAWNKLQDKVTEEVLFGGGAGGGKSWLGCEYLIKQCRSYPGARYFIGRDELKKIMQSTYVTMFKVLRFHKVDPDSLFKFNGQYNQFRFRNGSQIDLIDLGFKPSDPMFERFGSLEYTGGWIEEGGEVAEDASVMINSRTGRHMNDEYGIMGKTLITCNPKKNWLYYNFYLPKKENRLAPHRAFIPALAKDNTYGESGYILKLSRLTGATGMRLRDGNWEYDNDPLCLIETDAIGKVFEGFIWPVERESLLFYITVDVARFGRDFTVITVWKGWYGKAYKYRKLDTVEIALKVKEFMAMYSIPPRRVVVDADGIGGGVVDQLKCQQFVNNARPLPAPINPNRDEKGNIVPENYRSLKAQCYYRTAEKVNLGAVKLDIQQTLPDTTPEHERMLVTQEMEQVKRKDLDGDGKMDVVDREGMIEMLGRSPDYWSSIMMRSYFDIMPKNIPSAA